MDRENFKIIWNVTRWEFFRFFKWIDLIKGFVFLGFFSIVGGIVGSWLGSDTLETPIIAVADYNLFDPNDFEFNSYGKDTIQQDSTEFIESDSSLSASNSTLIFEDHTSTSVDSLKLMLETNKINAILTIHSIDYAEIQLPSERSWLITLDQFLKERRINYKLVEYGITAEDYASIEAGITLTRVFDEGGVTSLADKFVAGIAIFLVLMAVFMGFAYQFTAITAEKQQRITEQVISAISPQTWIDGKILGITGLGLVYILFYGLLGIIILIGMIFLGFPVETLLASISPTLVLTFLILALLGILMWNSFLAGIASTIDDPNTSQKSGLMMLPTLPILFAFFTLANPDSNAVTVLGMFPLTSYAFLPARMVLTKVPWYEPLIAILLLVITVWLFRKAAGKIFATGMMMFGKEPTFKEMYYWFKRA